MAPEALPTYGHLTLTGMSGELKGAVVARLNAADINELHARVCKALADPKRLLILNELRDGPRAVGEIAEAVGISQSNASRHLGVLRDRGFVTSERAGISIQYALASSKILRAMDLLRDFMVEERGWHSAGHSEPITPEPVTGVGHR